MASLRKPSSLATALALVGLMAAARGCGESPADPASAAGGGAGAGAQAGASPAGGAGSSAGGSAGGQAPAAGGSPGVGGSGGAGQGGAAGQAGGGAAGGGAAGGGAPGGGGAGGAAGAGAGGASGGKAGAAGAVSCPVVKPPPLEAPLCGRPPIEGVPPGWERLQLSPCTEAFAPGKDSAPIPDFTWTPCEDVPGIAFTAKAECLTHPWMLFPIGARLEAAAGGRPRMSLRIVPFEGICPPMKREQMDLGVDEEGKVRFALLTRDEIGNAMAMEGKRVAFWGTSYLSEGDPKDEHNHWAGGELGGAAILHESMPQDGFLSPHWEASSEWILQTLGGIRVSPWQPGKWTWILGGPDGLEPGPSYTFAQPLGKHVFVSRGSTAARVDVWHPDTGMKVLLEYPTDQVRQASRFHTDGHEMVWTYRDQMLPEPILTPDQVEQVFAVNDIYTAPFTTDAAELKKTMRRVRKEVLTYTGLGRWGVGGGYATIGGTPHASIVRLSDGAAWDIPMQQAVNEMIESYGAIGEYIYFRSFRKTFPYLVRFRIADLPPPNLPPG